MKIINGGFGLPPQEILELFPKINVSGLKQFNISPAYFESMQILKEIEPTKAMNLGTMLHYAILEPDKFEQLFVEEPPVIPDFVVDTVADLKEICKAEKLPVSGTKDELIDRLRDFGANFKTYDEFIDEYKNGRQILSKKQYSAAKRIIERIKSITAVDSILKDGEVEALGWVLIDEPRAVVTFRVDYFKPLNRKIAGYEQFAIDLKTTSQLSSNRDLQKLIAFDDTHIQAALYIDALEFITKKPTAFAVLAVETTAPYTVMLQVMGGASIECGRAQAFKNLQDYVECHKTKSYPTGFEKIGTVELPNWLLTEIENKEAGRLDESAI